MRVCVCEFTHKFVWPEGQCGYIWRCGVSVDAPWHTVREAPRVDFGNPAVNEPNFPEITPSES